MGMLLSEALETRLTHPLHRAAHAYWSSLRGPAGALPGRQDVDPVDIRDLLPWVSLVDVHWLADRLLFRNRLVGTGVVDMSDGDDTGRWLHDIHGPKRLARVQRGFEGVVRSGQPDLLHDDLADLGRPYWTMVSLILPLASNRRRVDMLLTVTQFA